MRWCIGGEQEQQSDREWNGVKDLIRDKGRGGKIPLSRVELNILLEDEGILNLRRKKRTLSRREEPASASARGEKQKINCSNCTRTRYATISY